MAGPRPPLRVSPEDGKIYSLEEFKALCEAEYTAEEIGRYWECECTPLADHPTGRFVLETLGFRGAEDEEEARWEPQSGELLSLRELHHKLRGRCSEEECLRYWGECRSWWRGPGAGAAASRSKERLVCSLCLGGLLRSEEVVQAMLQVDRWHYVPETDKAYSDTPQLLGPHATISAPHMHGQCLELLAAHLRPGMQALDVGCGSGYLSAVMARLVTRGAHRGHVVGIDHLSYLVELSSKNVHKADADLLSSGVLDFFKGDGWLGWPERAPFDAIHVGAAAPCVPGALLEQLKPGGRLLVPVGRSYPDPYQQLTAVDRLGDGSFRQREVCAVRYVPLVRAGPGPEVTTTSTRAAEPDHYEGVS